MADFGTYARNAAINALLRNTALQIAQAYASLHTGDPGTAGANELAVANAYIRKAATFGAPSGGATNNSSPVVFGPATPAGWSAAAYEGLWDQEAAGGNFIAGHILGTARTAGIGDDITFAATALTFALAGWSTYARNAVVNALLRNTALQVASTKISLHSGDPGLVGSNELTGDTYARVAATWDDPTSTPGVTRNTGAVTFATAGASWTAITHFGIWDAGTNFIYGNVITVSPKNVAIGETAKFAVGALVVTA